tara:strand:+ start:1065 stop:4358 length:3294 start_codon:yes stop_codon:yes gene_type:complete
LRGTKSQRIGRGPPRGSAPNAPPGAYGAWRGYTPPNPFVSGGYENYFDPSWGYGESFNPAELYGDPFIGPGGGRLGWRPTVEEYLNEYLDPNRTYNLTNPYNPLFSGNYEIDPNAVLRDALGNPVLDDSGNPLPTGSLVSGIPQEELGNIYGQWSDLDDKTAGSWYDTFPQYYDPSNADDPLGISSVRDRYEWLTPHVTLDESPWTDSPYGKYGQGWDMASDYWFSRPLGITDVFNVDNYAPFVPGDFNSEGTLNNPAVYTDPEYMVNRPFRQVREYNLGYGLGYDENGNIFRPIEGAQGIGERYSEDFQPYLFNPGGTALYGGPGSEYPFKTVEEWRRLAAEQAGISDIAGSIYLSSGAATPENLFGDPSGAGFTGQDWGTIENPLATSAWAQIYGGGEVSPGDELSEDDSGDYDWMKYEGGVGAQGYGGDPETWAAAGGDAAVDDVGVRAIIALPPEDAAYNEDLNRLGRSYGWLDATSQSLGRPELSYENASQFIRSHIEDTYSQIYNDGVFPDTYDQDLRLVKSAFNSEDLAVPFFMWEQGLTRSLHPAAGKPLNELTDSEKADLEKIIGSEGDYTNWSGAWNTNSEAPENIVEALVPADNIARILSGGTSGSHLNFQQGPDPLLGFEDNILSLSSFSEFAETLGFNEYHSVRSASGGEPLSRGSGMATSLESMGFGSGLVSSGIDPSVNPWIGELSNYQGDLSDYTTDDRSQVMQQPAEYGVVSDSAISLPPEMLGDARNLLLESMVPHGGGVYGYDIYQEAAQDYSGQYADNEDVRNSFIGGLFGMADSGAGSSPVRDFAFPAGGLQEATRWLPGSGQRAGSYPLMTGMVLGSEFGSPNKAIPGLGDPSNFSYSDPILGDVLDKLKNPTLDPVTGEGDLSVWGGGYQPPAWMSEVPLASEWKPYEPGAPSYMTPTDGRSDISQLVTPYSVMTGVTPESVSFLEQALGGSGFYFPIIVGMKDGGSINPTPEYASAEPSSDLIDMTVSAVMGEIENPDKVVKEFTEKYGPDALSQLVEDILAGGDGSFLRGPGDGRADDVPGLIDGTEPVFLSSGEYVVPADVVKDLGNGNTDGGAHRLMGMVDEIRSANNGR